MNNSKRLGRGIKSASALLLAALMTGGCLESSIFSANVNAASNVLSNEQRGVLYANSRSDFRDESIYFLITTRFYDGDTSNNEHCVDDTKAGNPDSDPAWRGDFKGLIEKLDYIKALGFTAIWITPVVQNNSSYDYHGYHGYDFTAVDYRYESNGITYQDLIDACHAKGMKIIQDVVFNHSCNWGEKNLCDLSSYTVWSGERSEMMMGTQKGLAMDPDKIYHHFGYCGGGDYDNYNVQITCLHSDCFDLNTENPTVYNYLIDCYKSFIDMGVDAFRVDTVKHMSRLTLNKTFVPAMQEEYKKVHTGSNYDDFYMFGEVCTKGESTWYREQPPISTCFYTWADDDTWLNRWTSDPDANIALTEEHYNAHKDMSNQPTTDNALLHGNDYHEPDNSIRSGLDSIDFQMHWQFDSAGAAFQIAKDEDPYFSDSRWSVTYINSHDFSSNNIQTIRPNYDQDTWAEDLDLIFTFRGIPCVYYGTETEFQAGKPVDPGPNAPLSETGRAYFGDNIEGSILTGDFGVFNASGKVADTLSKPLSQHIMRLNRIRQSVPALRKGQYSVEGCNGSLAFKRRYTDSNVDSFCCVTISGGATFTGIPNGTYVDAVTGDTKTVTNGTLVANVSGKGNMKVYVLSTSKTAAPGRIIPNGKFLTDGGAAELIGNQDINVVEPTGVSLNKTSVSVLEAESETITATVAPSDATNKVVSWSTSDASVATVSGGKITGVSVGTATITASTYNGKTATCTVTVRNNPNIIKPTGITVSPTSLTITAGQTGDLTATVLPSNATNKTVTWTSSDPSVATVNSSGVVTAVAQGNVTITASTFNGKTATSEITVEPKSFQKVDHGFYFEKPSGWGSNIKVYIYDKSTDSTVGAAWPGSAMTDCGDDIYSYEFDTSNSNIRIIFNDGNNQSPGSGAEGFTYTDQGVYNTSGLDYIYEDPVVIEVTSVSLNNTSLSLSEGATASLSATVAPSNATNKTITWSSNKTSVATVSSTGVVTAVAAGTATITATSSNGKTATCSVTVSSSNIPVTSVTLNNTSLSLAPGGTSTLTATVAPSNATDKTVTWSSNKTSVATVSTSGKVTAKAAGTAIITATSSNGKTATCTVTVSSAPSTLTNTSTINSDTLSLGQSVVFSGAAEGGTAPYRYAFYYKRASGKVWKAVGTEYGTVSSISFATTAADVYDLKVSVMDATGTTVEKQFQTTVTDGKSTAFKNTSTISTTGGKLGTKVRVYASATGSSDYTYAFYYKRTTARLWHRQKTDEFSATSAYQFTPTDTGIIDVRVDVKDKNNEIVSRHFTVTIGNDYVDTNTVVNLTASSYSALPKTRITVTANPTGGTAPYKYAFYYKRVEGKSWNLIGTEYGSTNYASLKPSSEGEFVFMAKVKDAKGGVTSENVNVDITNNPVTTSLQNDSTISATSVSSGTRVVMTGAASGGTAPYRYAFYYKRSTTSSWSVSGTEYATATTGAFTPASAGKFNVKIVVMDATGETATNEFDVNVT